MTIQWCCWKYATRFCGVIIGKVYAVWLGTLLYYMKVLSSSSDDFDYVRYEKIFFMYAYVTLPPLIGVILAIVMIYGIINKRSDLMAPGIVYNWTLISVVVLLIILQVILSSDFKNLEYLLIAVLFSIPCACVMPYYYVVKEIERIHKQQEQVEDTYEYNN